MSGWINAMRGGRWSAADQYGGMLAYLSLRYPALWQLRVDIVAAFSLVLLVLVIGSFGAVRLYLGPLGDSGPLVWASIFLAASLIAACFCFLWMLFMIRNARPRLEPDFRGKPWFVVVCLCVSVFMLLPFLIYLIGVAVTGAYDEPGLMSLEIRVGIIVIGLMSLFAKSVLLSSVLRTVGAIAIALGIAFGLLLIFFAVIGGARIFLYNLFPDIDSVTLKNLSGISGCYSILLTIVSIWFVSWQMFRSRRLGRGILVTLGILATAIVIEIILSVIYAKFRLAFLIVEESFVGRALAQPAAVEVSFAIAYLIPHIVAIGGDLVKGERTRRTSPVILSCFWSTPFWIIFCVAWGASAISGESPHDIYFGPDRLLAFGLAGVLSIVAIELLSCLAVRISLLPEP